MTVRRRGTFSSLQDFDCWFVKSKTGLVAQLQKQPQTDFRGRIQYIMMFVNPYAETAIPGSTLWTTDDILAAGGTIHQTQEEIDVQKKDS